jgi:presenilin-like A22 family membrane protease
MNSKTRAYLAGGAIVGIFMLVQLGALALVEPFKAQGYQAVENPSDPTNSLIYVGFILGATALMLAAIKYDADWILRVALILSGAFLAFYVFVILLPNVVTITVGGSSVHVLAYAAAALLGIALYVYPEWYVINAAGIVMGAGGAGLFGISFGIFPALLLLSILAVYDAISVYGTEHMLTLASGVMDLKVPVILVVPMTLSYSFLDADPPASAQPDGEGSDSDAGGEAATEPAEPDDVEAAEDALDRDALFIGLGDAVIPTILVASAGFFAPAAVPTLPAIGFTIPLPAATAMIGTIGGLVILLGMVLKGRAHAGLPLLNGGTIIGYLVGALASGIPIVQALGVAQYL